MPSDPHRAIDIVIPVYRGLAETVCCLESVLEARSANAHIVVVDDAAPDPAIAAYLDRLAAGGHVTLLRNDRNRGFVHSVNRGMALHPTHDVVLLNSDTRVANDWLARLHATAHGEDRVATVTPFSNNATICSYPFDGWNGGIPGHLGLAGLDALFARTLPRAAIDIPTAVGFCMYIRRAALDALGPFDEARFGRGYGEENDFCMRALKAGWRNVLACDTFVFHEGSVSFSAEKQSLAEGALRSLLDVHPDYLDRVRDWLARDPARASRDAIDAARSAVGARESDAVRQERALEATLRSR